MIQEKIINDFLKSKQLINNSNHSEISKNTLEVYHNTIKLYFNKINKKIDDISEEDFSNFFLT
jgi:hypothetical protein